MWGALEPCTPGAWPPDSTMPTRSCRGVAPLAAPWARALPSPVWPGAPLYEQAGMPAFTSFTAGLPGYAHGEHSGIGKANACLVTNDSKGEMQGKQVP